MRGVLTLQQECCDWVREAFGKECETNITERALRAAEEAIELAQSLGVSDADINKVTARVYSRDIGEPKQESAGAQFTLLVLAAQLGVDPLAACAHELARVRAIPLDYFRKKHADKIAAGTAVA